MVLKGAGISLVLSLCLALAGFTYGEAEYSIPTITQCSHTAVTPLPPVGSVTTLHECKEAWLWKSDDLCTIGLVSPESSITPIARSYDGNDWEAYAGDYAKVEIICDGSSCQLVLPPKPSESYSYQLMCFNHSLSRDDEVARFLEQTTFGPSRKDIAAFSGSFAAWIKDQVESKSINSNSHRQFFRERLNHRFEVSSTQGIATRACDANTRYRKSAFSDKDWKSPVEIRTDVENGRKVFLMHGEIRTFVRAETLAYGVRGQGPTTPTVEYTDGVYKICRERDLATRDFAPTWTMGTVGSRFILQHPDTGGCGDVFFDGVELGFPPVEFDEFTKPTNPTVNLEGHAVETETDNQFYPNSGPQELFIKTDLEDTACQLVPAVTGLPVYTVVGVYHGEYWLHDPRRLLFENTIKSPRLDGGGELVEETKVAFSNENHRTVCSNVNYNFMNEQDCILSEEANTCSPGFAYDYQNVPIELTVDTFQKIYDATGAGTTPWTRYVYAVSGLRQNEGSVPYNSPCTPSTTSRWIPVEECSGYTSVDESTAEVFSELLISAKKKNKNNPYLRDVTFPAKSAACHPNDVNKYDFAVLVDKQCWLNVHQNHLQVYDFTEWVKMHPGGEQQIRQFANPDSGSRGSSFILEFPSWHKMDRFHRESVANNRIEVGRFGDEIKFAGLPSDLLTEEIGAAFDAQLFPRSTTGPTVVCGSVNEVANVPSYHGNFFRGAFDSGAEANQTSVLSLLKMIRMNIWMEMAMNGDAQLRQRVAWALSQILAVSPDQLHETEHRVAFYDIFVRNAFGNYFDILKEVSYSEAMANMLSYFQNRGTEFTWRNHGRIEYPDENYAREIMQLFSIGLVELNNDGTPVVDGNNNNFPVLTYGNQHITEYARVWTGFDEQPRRGNIELKTGNNRVDPMLIRLSFRDHMPKFGLNERYIGDGIPLCSDLPEMHYLKKHATFRLLGSDPTPQLHYDPDNNHKGDWSRNANAIVSLPSDSELRKKLCNSMSSEGRGGGGAVGAKKCQFRSKVVLNENLPCTGLECRINAPRVIQVEPNLYYEYIRPRCGYQAFFNDGRLVQSVDQQVSCGDPRIEAASAACCEKKAKKFDLEHTEFVGERVVFSETERRCAASGLRVCKSKAKLNEKCKDCPGAFWTSNRCGLYVKLNLDGSIGIVHSPKSDPESVHQAVRQDTKTFFRVVWSGPIGDVLADYEGKCTELGGMFAGDDRLCLLPVTVTETTPFTDTMRPTRESILNELHFGAFKPGLYDDDTTTVTDLGNGVKMHSADGKFSRAIFEVVDDNGVTRYLKNLRSIVSVGVNPDIELTFRNPTHLIFFTDADLRDAHYETDAALEHYFYHKNTAPFLAIRFAQRFGISNPTPRYVGVIATAFRQGVYVDEESGISFGTGKYGDMLALTTATLLDREARSVILDADPAHGSLLEPFLKVVRTMRALEFQPDEDRPFIDLYGDIQDLIGQQPHRLPNVFSYFRPEYQPGGPVREATLVCPECGVLTTSKAVALNNGLLSLLKYGWDNAYGGFGFARKEWDKDGWGLRTLGEYHEFSAGHNTYAPAPDATSADVVDELATLLTSGRLSQERRRILQAVYDEAKSRGAHVEAYINVQQLIMSTPEFHANGLAPSTEEARSIPESPEPSEKPYRAVVNILLEGGMDSFNLLVPEVCEGKNDAGMTIDAQYMQERGQLAVGQGDEDRKLKITVDDDPQWTQPCTLFAIHNELKIVKELYDDGDLLFIANAGVINIAEGMDNSNWEELTQSQLFAHNFMQDETKMVDPFRNAPGTGILGRLSEVLTGKGFKSNSISIDANSIAVYPRRNMAPMPLMLGRHGADVYSKNYPQDDESSFDVLDHVGHLNNATVPYSNIFGETWVSEYTSGIHQAKEITNILNKVTVGEHWQNVDWQISASPLVERLKTISALIKGKDHRGVDRDLFFAAHEDYDHHERLQVRLQERFRDLNGALTMFVKELKDQGVWNDVTIVITSEFGRTMTANGKAGSDHGWGGHYWMMGGGVSGGRIVGNFPTDITPDGPLNIGRGRLLPTTSFDCIWNGVSEWMGADRPDELDNVLPNRGKATGTSDDRFTQVFTAEDLFVDPSSARNLRGSI